MKILIRYSTVLVLLFFSISCVQVKKEENKEENKEEEMQKVKLMTLDPGHFHAALVQKTMYPQVDSTIHVFAAEGPEVKDFLSKINQYNSRQENPTAWEINAYLGDDYIEKMISQKPGNVMVVAGKNSKKIDYILAAVKAGLNVYADKPLVINPQGFEKLKEAFEIAEEKGLLIYDIMTERFESTTMMQKQFSLLPDVFGELLEGTLDEPAISKESVHHFFKYVSGNPLVRPSWFFDVNEEGEGIVDVTTHLVDLIQWEAFPNQIIDSSQVEMVSARRWPTVLSLEEFQTVTGSESYPEYLEKDVTEDSLNVYCNGEMNYKINGKYAKVSVIWNYKAPEGTGDTHYSVMRGSKSNLIIKQGEAENYKPVLYVESKLGADFEKSLNLAVQNEIPEQFPGTSVIKEEEGIWKIVIPEQFKIGHEAHFGQVTENYLNYLASGELPDWEVPNMITKYYTTIAAYKKAKEN
ncbi:putative oxidoreductase C-terminal domain-containing protein [Maribacter sp. ACAM166]|uniref:putative oxidoreductase C-terminal domain-containing protein n=1 Tax=Maribacter sp. ACAM166 TaxID=2508996 RepID=UPI0010FD4BFD|nr:putative oxidoreductase C-terminal domain-containing protein [Maribacter sp. ACAM166]TLP70571.1 oxidoreductase [Maribacter sp. ACAM166]